MIKSFIFILTICALSNSARLTPLSWNESHVKAKAMLEQMTPEEKYQMMSGVGWDNIPFVHKGPNKLWYYAGNTIPVKRLGIPSFNFADAAGGFRDQWYADSGTSTCWPSLLSSAASFAPENVEALGSALAEEFAGKGANFILGPSINVHRVARNGRNFEYLSGEDPYLGEILTKAYIEGVQSGGVGCVAKHFVFNQQETNRQTESSVVDDRTAHELYFPPFRAAVDAGVSGIMCSYNQIDGVPSCSNEATLVNVLRDEFQFRGFVQSDWWANHETSSVTKGLDQDMPGTDGYFGSAELSKLNNTRAVDNAVKNLLAGMYHMNVFNSTRCTAPAKDGCLDSNVTSRKHRDLAERLATESIVLLKNENEALPLRDEKKIAVIGSVASAKQSDGWGPFHWFEYGDYYSGGGSGHVTAARVKTPLEGILEGVNGNTSRIVISDSDNIENAVKASREVDVAIILVGTSSREGKDRKDLSLDHDADKMIRTLSEQLDNSTRLVVLIQAPGAVVVTSWIDLVDACAILFLGGQQTGDAWRNVLFGAHNPTGRLPLMLPKSESDTIPPDDGSVVTYNEGTKTSYRNPNFNYTYPFGFGLSYTTFEFSNLTCDTSSDENEVIIRIDVKNTGQVSGRAVPQLYVSFPENPVSLLKGFQRTDMLRSGETQRQVEFRLRDVDLSHWDQGKWNRVSNSELSVKIGTSSAHFVLEQSLSAC